MDYALDPPASMSPEYSPRETIGLIEDSSGGYEPSGTLRWVRYGLPGMQAKVLPAPGAHRYQSGLASGRGVKIGTRSHSWA